MARGLAINTRVPQQSCFWPNHRQRTLENDDDDNFLLPQLQKQLQSFKRALLRGTPTFIASLHVITLEHFTCVMTWILDLFPSPLNLSGY